MRAAATYLGTGTVVVFKLETTASSCYLKLPVKELQMSPRSAKEKLYYCNPHSSIASIELDVRLLFLPNVHVEI